jgi:hypothetical protein
MSTALVKTVPQDLAEAIESARGLIEQTDDIGVARGAVAQADGWKSLLRSIGESQEKQNACAELKLRAIRRVGELLLEMREPSEGNGPKDRFVTPEGMRVDTASRWRSIGAADADAFEEYIQSCKLLNTEMTYSGLRRFLPHSDRGRGFAYGSEVRDRAATLRGEGLSYTQIAELLTVSPSTIKYWLDVKYRGERLQRKTTHGERRKREATKRQAAKLRRAGDPLGELEPHLRKAAEALQNAVDAADNPDEQHRRSSLFPLVYGLEDALRMVMQGRSPRQHKEAA